MIARSLHRPRPIPFAVPNRLAADPAGTGAAPAPRPVHWGDRPGGALIVQVEDPRALYAVTRTWQGHKDTDAEQASGRAGCSASASTAAPSSPATHRQMPSRPAPIARDGQPTELTARYMGRGSLCVRSSVTGRHYRFQGHGDTLRIDKHDQMLMRRISDIELA